jgi:hypothetical protein
MVLLAVEEGIPNLLLKYVRHIDLTFLVFSYENNLVNMDSKLYYLPFYHLLMQRMATIVKLN